MTLAELGEGVLQGRVVGRALGVLHVRHFNWGLVDHARGRVERRRAPGGEAELVDDHEVAIRACGGARADGGVAGRLAGGVFPLEDGEAALAGKGGGRGRALGKHLHRLFGLCGIEEQLAFGRSRRSATLPCGVIHGLALHAVDALGGVGNRVADGAGGDRGGGEGLDLAAVLRDLDGGGGLVLEARDERGSGEVGAEAGRFACGQDLVGDYRTVGIESHHQLDGAAVAFLGETRHRIAGDLRLGVVRIADEHGDLRVAGGVAGDRAGVDGLDGRRQHGAGGGVRLERGEVRDALLRGGVDDGEHGRADGRDDRQGEDELQDLFHFLTFPKGLGWVKRLMSGVNAFMTRIENETPSG